jgi:hypothetical protein
MRTARRPSSPPGLAKAVAGSKPGSESMVLNLLYSVPGAVIAIQTFGDLLGFNPHCHILITDILDILGT